MFGLGIEDLLEAQFLELLELTGDTGTLPSSDDDDDLEIAELLETIEEQNRFNAQEMGLSYAEYIRLMEVIQDF